MEPSVSVPMVPAARAAAAADPLPLDEPQLLRSSACGFLVKPPTALQPLVELSDRILAHSLKLVLPKITAPAARKRAMNGASRLVILPASASDPAVVAMGPATSTLSFTKMGMPCIGPRYVPARNSASIARAWSSASGKVAMTAFSVGPLSSTAAIRARYAAVIASLFSVPSSTPSASWERSKLSIGPALVRLAAACAVEGGIAAHTATGCAKAKVKASAIFNFM